MENDRSQQSMCEMHAKEFPLDGRRCVNLRASDAGPEALDFLAAFVLGHERSSSGGVFIPDEDDPHFNVEFKPSRDARQCGKLILERGIGLSEPLFDHVNGKSKVTASFKGASVCDEDPKIAAIKAFVVGSFGEGLIAVPDDLDWEDEDSFGS